MTAVGCRVGICGRRGRRAVAEMNAVGRPKVAGVMAGFMRGM